MSGMIHKPYPVNRVLVARTGYGFIARCGCGWRSLHESEPAAISSGDRHVHDQHGEDTE